MTACRCSARLPGRQSLRVYAEGDKEADLGTEAKPQEAGGNFYNDERPVSLLNVLVLSSVDKQSLVDTSSCKLEGISMQRYALSQNDVSFAAEAQGRHVSGTKCLWKICSVATTYYAHLNLTFSVNCGP